MSNTLDNRLPMLADEIRAEHQKVIAAAGAGITAARAAGAALIEAKEKLPHGAWLPWLSGLPFGIRTAQNYMKLARLPEANAQRIAHLGLARGLRELADRSELLSPRADDIVHGRAGREITDFECYEREIFIWRSSKYPEFFWMLNQDNHSDGSGTMCTVHKPVPDVVSYLKHWGFPVDAAEWQVKRDDRLRSVLEEFRSWVFAVGPEERWYWRDGDR